MILLDVYTDGSYMKTKDAMGYAFCIEHFKKRYDDSGKVEGGTSNGAEALAILKALEFIDTMDLLRGYEGVNIHTDSKYCVNSATQWLDNWKKKNWVRLVNPPNGYKIISNKPIWEGIDKYRDMWYIKWTWIQGHSGHELNEFCNKMAKQRASQ